MSKLEYDLNLDVNLQIDFTDFDQKILAVQAPNKNMVSGFWQMVPDQKVSVIAMITKLVENNKVKANHYWPDENAPTLELENNITVTFVGEETGTGLTRRSFLVSDKSILSNM